MEPARSLGWAVGRAALRLLVDLGVMAELRPHPLAAHLVIGIGLGLGLGLGFGLGLRLGLRLGLGLGLGLVQG